ISVFIVALFTVVKLWKQPKCPSTDKWIKKMWHTHTEEYYSARRKKEILPSATTCVELDDVMLNEISQTEKDKFCLV
ncbi:LORF2 protein, partial [Crocuta crocuta]